MLSCIIPAYNEQDRVAAVARAALDSACFGEILVVDDSSGDYTAAAVQGIVACASLPERRGKAGAVAYGLGNTSGEWVCLLDADLEGISAENIRQLAGPVVMGAADVSISVRANCPFPRFDILTGERVLRRSTLEACNLDDCRPMELESRINEQLIRERARIALVTWPNVKGPTKYAKYGLARGLREDVRMYRDLWSVGLIRLIRQARGIGKLVEVEVAR